MKRFSIPVAIILAAALFFMGAQVVLTGKGYVSSQNTNTYANSQTDTVTYYYEGAESALAFYLNAKDSVRVTNGIVVRYFNGRPVAHVGSTDTLFASVGFTATTADTCVVKALTLAPAAEMYKFIIRYNAAGNGVTSPTVKYGVVKTFSAK